ncbi:MAG: hypothetical protein ACPGVH_03900 [Chitinophagales bacterium]
MKKNNTLKILLLLFIVLFNLNTYAGEDDATIVMFAIEQRIEVSTSIDSEIETVQIFDLYNPNQYFEVLGANSCNENQNACTYFFDKRNLIKGQVYRIKVYTSKQTAAVEYTFIP